MMLNDPKQFLRSDKRFKIVDIPSLGSSIRLRSITGSEFIELSQIDNRFERIKFMFCKMIVDENGFGILTEDYCDEIFKGDAAVTEQLLSACNAHISNVGSVDDAKKNSSETSPAA